MCNVLISYFLTFNERYVGHCTVKYYDKKLQMWKFTSGNFTNPRYCYLFRFSDSNLVEESIEMEILLSLFFTPSRSCFIFQLTVLIYSDALLATTPLVASRGT